MKKIFVVLLVLFSVTVSAKTPTKKVTIKVYNSKEYSIILDKFMTRAEKYLETGDKKSLLDDYIKNIESSRVMKKALEDNYDKDKEAFSLVEVALFMKSSYSEGEDAKKLTDEDYKEMQEKFVKTKKYKQLEDYVTIQTTTDEK
ncbi:hypothetical protein VYE96_06895 [Fusobacterium pseudoperiodonticum]|nr:hypothetical protein [Fusobacterium pseudoperiodonticum]